MIKGERVRQVPSARQYFRFIDDSYKLQDPTWVIININKQKENRNEPEEISQKQYEELMQQFEPSRNIVTIEKDQDKIYHFYLLQFEEMITELGLPEIKLNQSIEWAQHQPIQSAYLPKNNSPTAEQIHLLANQLASLAGDLSYFWRIWSKPDRDQFISGLIFIIAPQNWPTFRYQFEPKLELFLEIFNKKVRSATFLQIIYPDLLTLVKWIEKVVERPYKQPIEKEEEYNARAIYEFFIQEIESKFYHKGGFYIRREQQSKTPIGDYIAHGPFYQGSYEWADILSRASIHKRAQLQKTRKEGDDEENEKEIKNRKQFNERILKGEQLLPTTNKLCCAKFFYYHHNIYDQKISECIVLSERCFNDLWEEEEKSEKGAKKKSQELEKTIIDICALLNSGGGVLLFNTFRKYLQLWPKGELMAIFQFTAARQLIAKQLNSIYPRVEMNKHIFVSFVPVVRNPITDGLASEGRYYVDGLYVMRIVVRPQDEGQQVYFYSKQPSYPFCVPVVVGNTTRILKRPVKFMKQRFASYHISDCQDQEVKAMLKRNYSNFTHQQCIPPEEGLPLAELLFRNNQNDVKLQQKYKYMTLLVTGRHNYPIIQQKLIRRGIECDIVVKYNNYGFKAANNSAALLHNVTFSQILGEMAYQKDFQFQNRYVLIILVTPYIRLTERKNGVPMQENEFQTLQEWLATEHPKEQLQLWKYQDGNQIIFYMKTQSKFATLFLYFILTNFNQKCHFKNPKDQNKLTLIYPKPQKGNKKKD